MQRWRGVPDERTRSQLGQLLGLTALGAVLPGVGLVAAGRRFLGGVVLTVFLGLAAVAALLAATGRLDDVALQAAVRPAALIRIAFAAALLTGLWCGVIVGSHLALRRHYRLIVPQRLLWVVVVAALCAPIIAAGAQVTRYALIQRDLVSHVFGNPPVPTTGTRPDRTITSTAPGPEEPPAHRSTREPSQQPTTQRPEPVQGDPWHRIPRINVLLLGSDAGPGRIGIRPDSIIVASIDTHSGNTALISLPRNLQAVPFPSDSPLHRLHPDGYDCGVECRLNAVWRNIGEAHRELFPGDPNPGLTATWQAVEATLGIRLDRYVLVNLHGFIEVIDALGGVTVDVPHRLAVGDPAAPDAVIQPGVQHLDGRHALWFARVRQGYDDYDRMRRQRCLLGSLADQARPIRLVPKLPGLAKTAKATVETDIPTAELRAFATLARRIKGAEITSIAFTNEIITPSDPDFAQMRRLTRTAIQGTERPGRPYPSHEDPPSGRAKSLDELC